MNTKNKRVWILVLTILLLFAAAGCGEGQKAQTDAVPSEGGASKVTIMSATNYFPFIIAYEKGFFQEEFGDEVEVTYSQVTSGSLIMETMTAGEADFAALGDMPVIQARVNGLDVKLLSSLFTSTTGYQLIAAKDSDIHSIEDLKGKKVAVMSGSTSHKLFLKYLEAAGLSVDDMEVYFIKKDDQLAAFVGKNVDAAVTQVPTSTIIEEQTGAYEVVNAEGYDNILTVVVGRNEFMLENPDYAEKFLRALIRANEWTENNLEQAIQIVADASGDTYKNEELYYNTRTFRFSLGEDILAAFEDTIDYLYGQGTISKKPAIEDMVEDSYLKAAEVGK